MKRVISAVLLLTVLLVCLWWWWYSHHQDKKPFRCDTQQILALVKRHSNIVLNANSTIIFYPSKTGIVYITGSIMEDGTQYLLDRKVFFTISPSELKGAINTQFTREEVHPIDNTPDDLWHNILMPEVSNVNFHMEIIPLLHNAVLVKGLTNPILVCTRQD